MSQDTIIHMEVRNITSPFNNGSLVEVILKSPENRGELYLRVSADQAHNFKPRQDVIVKITKI